MREDTRFAEWIEDLGRGIKGDILEALREEEPLTIRAIANRANLSWQTARKRLHELVNEDEVIIKEIEGSTKLFFLNHKKGV